MRRSSLLLLASVAAAATLSAQARPAGRPAGTPAAPAARGNNAAGQDSAAAGMPSSALNAFRWRSIGPAFTSGRIGDIAVHPNKTTWYVAVASGGVWKTENAGTTWSPIFDGQASYSIGTVVLDPNNPEVVWVGSGENNAQRSVSFGDRAHRQDRRRPA
jgi:hypothetical protein